MNAKSWKNTSLNKLKDNYYYANDDVFWLGNILNKLLGKYELNFNYEIDEIVLKNLNSDLEKLLRGQPIEQILGYTYFNGEKIEVFPGVLVPRPDSETLIETVHEYIPYLYSRFVNLDIKKLNILEIGIGSGALSISVAKILESLGVEYRILGSDISKDAIKASTININNHNLSDRINVELADLWPSEVRRGVVVIDLLLSNPPYIAENEIEDESMFDFEPKAALIADNNGLNIYNRIFNEAKDYLYPGAIIILEHSHKQKETLMKLAEDKFNYIKTNKDLAMRDRVSVFLNN